MKSQIPVRTWADWDDAVPGFAEIDLVGHEGGNASGEFCFTLTVTDIATGWTINRSVRNKAQRWVFEALAHVVASFPFPFPILGIDSDNGSEFINDQLLRWCIKQKVTFTRSRPGNKNDGAHVEQKNWARVPRADRLLLLRPPPSSPSSTRSGSSTPCSPNYFLPQQKLVFKQRHGAKVTKRHEQATTPHQRAITHAGMRQRPIITVNAAFQTAQASSTVQADPRADRRARSPRPGQEGTPLKTTGQHRLEPDRLAEETK